MSKVGKKTILIPEGVEIKIEDQKITVKSSKGELSRELRPEIGIKVKDNQIFVFPKVETKKIKALWGLTRALIFSMIKGVTEGYEKKLQIIGLGFRASLEQGNLVLQVGFSHSVKIEPSPGIEFFVEKNIITVSGIDKELVGQVAAKIRKVRPPEPYKGKGIRYLEEVVRQKAGKKAATAK